LSGETRIAVEINGAENTYVEAKLTPAMRPWTEVKIVGESGRKQIGSEAIDGHPTKNMRSRLNREERALPITSGLQQT